MADTKDKVITAESLKAKHDYDEATYLKQTVADTTYLKTTEAGNTYVKKTDEGTLILTNANDAKPTEYNSPALVVGGTTDAPHLEIDTNEILAKKDETTPDNLFLNDDVERDGVRVGVSGAIDIYKTGITPRTASTINVGNSELPFNHMYGVNYNLYNKYDGEDTDYGALRVGFTENDDEEQTQRPTSVLKLGNDTNVDSRITMYGNGATFTNILPNNATTGSNKVTLPLQSGMLALSKTGTYQGYKETGTQSNPMSLAFEFEPNIIFIWRTHTTETQIPTTDCVYGVLFRGGNGIYRDSSGTTKIIKTTWGVEGNSKRVQWYTEETDALYGLSGVQNYYSYIAF